MENRKLEIEWGWVIVQIQQAVEHGSFSHVALALESGIEDTTGTTDVG